MTDTPMLNLIEQLGASGYGTLWLHEDDLKQLSVETKQLRSLAVSDHPSIVDELRTTLLRERTPREQQLEKDALKAIHRFLYEAFQEGVSWAEAHARPGADSVRRALEVADDARKVIADILRRTGLT